MADIKKNICHICSYYDTPLFSDLVNQQSEFSNPRVFYYQYYNHTFVNGEREFVDKCACYNYWERVNFFGKQNKAIKAYKNIYYNASIQLNFSHSLFTNGYVAYRIKKEWKIPYIVAIQNTDINIFLKYIFWLKNIGISILLQAEKVLISSESYKKTLFHKYLSKGIKEQIERKIEIVPYGISDFYNKNRYNELKKIEGELKIISVGRINKNKNHLLLCKAIAKGLRKKVLSNVTVEIVGETENTKILKRIQKYPFVTYCSYMPPEQLIEHYRRANIFILVSKTETFGLVYAEALSQGLPIIYTKGQGFDTQFCEGIVGFHTRLREDSIIEKIILLINQYDKIQPSCSEKANKFLWETINFQYKRIYSDVIVN